MPDDLEIADGEEVVVKEVREDDPPREGVRGTHKVSIANFNELESREVVRNIENEAFAEEFAEDLAEAERFDRQRTARAQALDEEMSAPLTLDLDDWKADPDHLDFPGVDSEQRKFGTREKTGGIFDDL